MKKVEQELEILKDKLNNSFIDPLPSNVLKNFVLNGSKYIRSVLAIYYLKAQNCELSDDIYRILSVGEMIHNSSLLHDDVIDEAEKRRGKITIAKEFSSKISILAGDYLLSEAIEELLVLGNSEIINLFINCAKKMCESELKQFSLREKLPTKEEYISICEGKTANLFATVLESCAIIAQLPREKARLLGKIYGTCFQIKNDFTSKSVLEDKYNGINTAKDILGIENTLILLDNYKEKIMDLLEDIPANIYKEELEGLIESLS